MKVFFPVSELTTFYQLGGLGDVAASLPKALSKLKVDVRIALPLHPGIIKKRNWPEVDRFSILFNNTEEVVKVYQAKLAKTRVPVYLFSNAHFLSKASGVADDSIEKFSFFSLAAAYWLIVNHEQWQPDLIHLHDWHVALVPVVLKHLLYQHYTTLLTIHNLNFQGKAAVGLLHKLHLPKNACEVLKWDAQNHQLNLLMEGIIHADWVNAVSPTYAKEILTNEYAAGLQPVIESLSAKTSGIVNGIDTDYWNPSSDPHLAMNFSADTAVEAKTYNKHSMLSEFNLTDCFSQRLAAYIGRVDPQQKGIDLIIAAIKRKALATASRPFIFLGTGDPNLEQQLTELAQDNPYLVNIHKFDEPLAHRLYSASDLMIMPSKYEPCGLVQLIAMRYGSIPLVRNTGGLADTVIDQSTGFVFDDYTPEAFIDKLDLAYEKLQNHHTYEQMLRDTMTQDFSWNQSAAAYHQLYKKLTSIS